MGRDSRWHRIMRRRTISIEELREQMKRLPAVHRERGSLPEWTRQITDWALNEALETKTFSSPWEKGLLRAEKERRERWHNFLKPAWIGGVCGAVAGALISGFISWLTR
jgi:hypothetical protein